MHFDTFTDNHLCNFSNEELFELFDWEAVATLDDNQRERQRVLWLSQFLVGNVSATFREIKELDSLQQWRTFESWISLIDDTDTLKGVTRGIIYSLLRGE